MPRISRGLADGHWYHVINRGNGRQQVFHKDEDYQAFVDLLAATRKRYALRIGAWVLMPNHFHLLVQPEQGDELSRGMQWLMTSHVRRYHGHYRTSGHVWQGRYKNFIVQEDAHLLTVVRYIEGNPVRVALAGSARGWRWSSHGENCGAMTRALTSPLPVPLPEGWTAYVDDALTPGEQERLQRSIDRQAPFGGCAWQEAIACRLGLEATMRSRGRPRKAQERDKK